jgi:heptosyltransferase-2
MSARSGILITRFSSLGDIILTTPLIRATRTAYPDAHITFATKREYVGLLETNPHVTEVAALEPRQSLVSFAASLRRRRFDYRIDLHSSLRSIALRRLVPGRWVAFAKPRYRRYLLIGGVDAARLQPVSLEYFRAVAALPIVPDDGPAEVFTTSEDEADAARVASGDYVVLAPGAGQATKQWPSAHWADLADRLRGTGLAVVAVGSDPERGLLGAARAAPAFGLPIRVTAALCRKARAVVVNDSGVMHLATAMGARVIALFGPTVPALGFAPYRAPATLMEARHVRCRPCSTYGSARCPAGHHRCLHDLRPDEVERAVLAAA